MKEGEEEEELQQDMAKREAKSGPLPLCRAWACSGKPRIASRPKKGEAAGSRHAGCGRVGHHTGTWRTTRRRRNCSRTWRRARRRAGHSRFAGHGHAQESQGSPADRRRRRQQECRVRLSSRREPQRRRSCSRTWRRSRRRVGHSRFAEL